MKPFSSSLIAILLSCSLQAAPDNTSSVTPKAPDTTTTVPTTSGDMQDLSNLRIDQLTNVQVTSAGDRHQKLSDVAFALSVINSDEIERSGATNIPDLLRYTPGVQVGQASNGQNNVAIRGFGGTFSNSLLVLVDGVSVYVPGFGGTDWPNQPMIMDNIERVEVIRGSGAALWGANAVNGVINIITKDSDVTQGGYLSTLYGTKESGTGQFRYGLHPFQDFNIRFYGMYQQEDPSTPDHGNQRFDTYNTGTGGFRADYRPTVDDHFRFSVDATTTRSGLVINTLAPNRATGFTTFTPDTFVRAPGFPFLAPLPVSNFNDDDQKVNFVYERTVEPDNIITVQSSYWRTADSTTPVGTLFTSSSQNVDFQVRHSLPINLLPIKQDLVYGAEYRLGSYKIGPGIFTFTRAPADQTFSAFAQTDLHLIEDVLTLTGGVRYDHNDYTGNEVQPSLRLIEKINATNSVWLAASRSVVEPHFVEQYGTGLFQNNNYYFKSEVKTEGEIGYRTQPLKNLSLDVTGYYNKYSNILDTYTSGNPLSPDLQLRNVDKADVFGIEPSFQAELQSWWHLSGSYSYNKVNFHPGPSFPGFPILDYALNQENITNLASLHTGFDLPEHVTIDLGERYSERAIFASGYTVTDIRVGWKPTTNWGFSVDARNLFMANHIENTGAFNNSAYVGPEVYGKIAYNF